MTARRLSSNNAQSNKWFVRFSGALSDIHLKIYNVDLPTVTTGTTILQSDQMIDLNLPGTKLTFEALNITFFIEEGWENYFDLYKWLRQYVQDQDTSNAIDVILIPLDSEGRLLERAFVYKSCSPQMLSTFLLDNENGTTDMTAQITLNIEDIDIEKGRILDLDYNRPVSIMSEEGTG